MEVFLHIDLNLFMVFICIIMFFSSRSMNERQMVHLKIFRMLILSNLLLLVLESITWLLDGYVSSYSGILYYIVTILLYLITPLPAAFWALFVNYQLFHDSKRLKQEAILFGIPIAISSLITLITPWTGIWFTIDSANIYQRGAWYPLLALISFWPMLYASGSILIHRKKISKKLLVLMLMFMAPPFIGFIVQTQAYGTTVLWSSITISIFLVHSNLQSTQSHLDHLTGLNNRRLLDAFLTDRFKMTKNRQPLSCIMLDINHFKSINDKLGHVAGDEALKDASAILKDSIRKGDFLARFGGDEFVILAEIAEESTLKDMSNRIRDNVLRFNNAQDRPYTLEFSIGYAVYNPDSGWDKNEFIAHVDALMYENKTSAAG